MVTWRSKDKKPYDNIHDGGGAKKLADAFGIPLKKAQELIKLYYKQFPKLKPYFDAAGKQAKQDGFILINEVTKRKSYIDEFEEYDFLRNARHRYRESGWFFPEKWEDRYSYLDAVIQRHSQNYRIQGTSADMSKLAGIYLREEMQKNPIFDIVLLIHDEWVVECKEEDSEKVKEILEDCMVRASRFFLKRIEIPADAKINKKWSK